MFEKEAEERAERKISNFIPQQWGVSLIRTEPTYETVEGAPHFYLRSLAKMWKEGAECGYNKGYHDAEKHYMNVIDCQQKLVVESKAKQDAEEAEENRKLKILVKALLYEINQIWDINEMDPDVREAAEQIEMEEDGVALQSDMDKTNERYMKQKEINKELVDESEKLKEEICYQRRGWEKATVKLGTALLKLDLAKAIIKNFRDYFRANVNPCPETMLEVIMQADKFLEE